MQYSNWNKMGNWKNENETIEWKERNPKNIVNKQTEGKWLQRKIN